MRYAITVTIIILTLFIVGCGSNPETLRNEYHFIGENDSWRVSLDIGATEVFDEFKERLDSASLERRELILIYTKDISTLSNIDTLEYSYDLERSGSAATLTFTDFPPETSVFRDLGGGSSVSVFHENDEIDVIVKIDGVEEIIVLRQDE
jgi:hypothetical protein